MPSGVYSTARALQGASVEATVGSITMGARAKAATALATSR